MFGYYIFIVSNVIDFYRKIHFEKCSMWFYRDWLIKFYFFKNSNDKKKDWNLILYCLITWVERYNASRCIFILNVLKLIINRCPDKSEYLKKEEGEK